MGASGNGSRRVGAVIGIAAVCAALVAGTGQALADPCETTTVPTTTTTEPLPTTTTTDPVPTTTTTDPIPTTTTTEPIPTTTSTEPEPQTGPSDYLEPNIVFPSYIPPTSHPVNSFKTCESDTVDPETVAPQLSPSAPSSGPTPSSLPPTYAPPTTPPPTGPVDPPPNNAWIPLVVLCALAIGTGMAARAWRHRGQKFLKTHVTVASHPGLAVPFDIRPTDDPDRDHILAVTSAEASRSATVEEVRS